MKKIFGAVAFIGFGTGYANAEEIVFRGVDQKTNSAFFDLKEDDGRIREGIYWIRCEDIVASQGAEAARQILMNLEQRKKGMPFDAAGDRKALDSTLVETQEAYDACKREPSVG